MAQRDYAYRQVHSYQTPRKQIRRQQLKAEIIKRRVIVASVITGTVCLLGALIYGAFWSPLFRIQSIAISGVTESEQTMWLDLLRDYTSRKTWFICPRNNYFLLSTDKVREYLAASGDEILMFHNFDIKKKWPNKLEVSLFERQPYLKINQYVNHYYIDQEGVRLSDKIAFKATTKTASIPSVDYISNAQKKVGETVLSPEFIKKIIIVLKAWQEPGLPLAKSFTVNSKWSQIEVKTKAGYRIILSLDRSLQDQLNYLRLVLQKIGDKGAELKYIDLRIENRAYTCCNLENLIEP